MRKIEDLFGNLHFAELLLSYKANKQTKPAGSNPLFEAGIEELLRTEKC